MIELPALPKKFNLKRIAVLTSGGDAPGMNAAVRGVVRFAIAHKMDVLGVYKGYSGLIEKNFQPMTLASVANIIQRGGTLLKTDRCPAFHQKSVRAMAVRNLRDVGVEGLVVIGGDGSFTGAALLEKETGLPTIGIPGTIDNDIAQTDETIGFDTAVNTALDAIDRIRDTASSHDRLFLVEVMGRNSGFIALDTGIGGGAETAIVPEAKLTLSKIEKAIRRSRERGKTSSILVVAEGPKPGLADRIAHGLEASGLSAKVCTLGHIQRGGSPSARDRLLGSILGSYAVAYLASGKTGGMVGVQKNRVVYVPFSKVIGAKKKLPALALRIAEILAT